MNQDYISLKRDCWLCAKCAVTVWNAVNMGISSTVSSRGDFFRGIGCAAMVCDTIYLWLKNTCICRGDCWPWVTVILKRATKCTRQSRVHQFEMETVGLGKNLLSRFAIQPPRETGVHRFKVEKDCNVLEPALPVCSTVFLWIRHTCIWQETIVHGRWYPQICLFRVSQNPQWIY